MAALRSQFDSNKDGKLTAADAGWGQFKVMVTGANGAQSAFVFGDNHPIAASAALTRVQWAA